MEWEEREGDVRANKTKQQKSINKFVCVCERPKIKEKQKKQKKQKKNKKIKTERKNKKIQKTTKINKTKNKNQQTKLFYTFFFINQ